MLAVTTTIKFNFFSSSRRCFAESAFEIVRESCEMKDGGKRKKNSLKNFKLKMTMIGMNMRNI